MTPEERASAETTQEQNERKRQRELAKHDAELAKQHGAQQAIAELLVNSLGDQLDALLNLVENAGKYWSQVIEPQLRHAAANRSAA